MKNNQSLLTQHFLHKLSKPSIKIVSFDIFDTLVFRKSGEPKSIFKLLGKKKSVKKVFENAENFSNYRIEAEKSARLGSNAKEISLKEIYAQMPLNKKQQIEFAKLEVELENKMLVANTMTDEWIDLAYKMGKKIILISDMYLNEKQIYKTAISKLKNKDKISHIYISSKSKKTKSSSELFGLVKDNLSVEFKNIFHIGDNKHSDVLIPSSLGIETLYYNYSEHELESLTHEKDFAKQQNSKALHVRKLSVLQNPYDDEFKRFYYFLGSSIFAPLLWEFSHFLADICKTQNLHTLNFMTREGIIFEKYFKQLYPDIKTNIIYASRGSTEFLDIDADKLDAFNTSKYRSFKIEELYNGFFLNIKDKNIKKYKKSLLDDAKNIYIDNSTLLQLIHDDINSKKHLIKKQIAQKRKVLKKYLDSFKIYKNSALIDFGGRGTTNKKLIRNFLKDTKSILFYKTADGHKQDKKVLEFAFLQYSKENEMLIHSLSRTPEFLEVILNLDAKTCIGYKQERGNIYPLCFLPNCNQNIIQDIKKSFLYGIDIFFQNAKMNNIKKQSFNNNFLLHMLSRITLYPTKNEVNLLSKLEQHEGILTNHSYPIVKDEHLRQVELLGVEKCYLNFSKNPLIYKYKFPWIEGVITLLEPNFFDKFYKYNANANQTLTNDILQKLSQNNIKTINIYGAGEFFLQLLPFLQQMNIKIDKIIDRRAQIEPFKVKNYEVVSLENALKISTTTHMIICSNVFKEEIINNIKAYSSNINKKVEIVNE